MTAPGDLRHGQATSLHEVIKYNKWNMNSCTLRRSTQIDARPSDVLRLVTGVTDCLSSELPDCFWRCRNLEKSAIFLLENDIDLPSKGT